ncbi:hypothetical protein [Geothrix sp.]|jgi:hypothetical protein|uniref:hypothetical protein n=1 Tax=Geothrix sp. TaxID=1962974 RepID=UPI0025BD7CFF|nr:hypothetical protein [Geothrix sp.]
MTVLLVMFLFLAFVGTDHVVRLATRRAAARRAAAKLGEAARIAPPRYAELTKRAVG